MTCSVSTPRPEADSSPSCMALRSLAKRKMAAEPRTMGAAETTTWSQPRAHSPPMSQKTMRWRSSPAMYMKKEARDEKNMATAMPERSRVSICIRPSCLAM